MKSDFENRILFIRGFNTDNIETKDAYAHIHCVLSQKNSITYFNYNPDDDIVETYKNLCKTIKRHKFTHLIGHSMGGGLLMKYISEHRKEIPKYKKVILLMPLIYKVPLNNFVFKIPLLRNVRVPKSFILPASKLQSLGNFINDTYNLISLQQVYDMYNYLMLESDDFVAILNKHRKNTVVFYAKEEAFNTIHQDTLDKIHNVEYVDGLHQCFNELSKCKSFFRTFLRYI
jgi:pimeloyl-ACP methyl ester carboxylesterase